MFENRYFWKNVVPYLMPLAFLKVQCKILLALNEKIIPFRVLNFKPYSRKQNIPSPPASTFESTLDTNNQKSNQSMNNPQKN